MEKQITTHKKRIASIISVLIWLVMLILASQLISKSEIFNGLLVSYASMLSILLSLIIFRIIQRNIKQLFKEDLGTIIILLFLIFSLKFFVGLVYDSTFESKIDSIYKEKLNLIEMNFIKLEVHGNAHLYDIHGIDLEQIVVDVTIKKESSFSTDNFSWNNLFKDYPQCRNVRIKVYEECESLKLCNLIQNVKIEKNNTVHFKQ